MIYKKRGGRSDAVTSPSSVFSRLLCSRKASKANWKPVILIK
jgi:hypothetical protein